MTRADASTISQTATVLAGRTNAFAFKLGPAITSVQSSVSTGLPGLTVSGNSNITVTGSGFMSANTQLFANTTPLTISSVTDIQITAFLPGGFNGLVPIKVTTPSGQHTINILTASASPVMTVTSVGNGGSGAEGAIAPGEIIQIKGSLLGPSTGVSFSINAQGKVDTILGGVRVLFGTIAAPITYASAAQVNAIVPYEVAGTSVVMKVEYQGVQSAGTTLQVASAAPGVFTFNATGTGQAIAYNLADGSFNGPNAAVAKSGSVAVYFTGGGQTTPPGETGSVNGSTLKVIPPQNLFVTVGGKQVISAAAAAAPTLVDGVQQLNIQIAPNTPSGAQPLVISVNGISSPSTATLSVQ
jgi:uncharacterized protein (TIGR03437 family)